MKHGHGAGGHPVVVQMQFKTAEELAVMQYANDIASAAHVELLRYAKPGPCLSLA